MLGAVGGAAGRRSSRSRRSARRAGRAPAARRRARARGRARLRAALDRPATTRPRGACAARAPHPRLPLAARCRAERRLARAPAPLTSRATSGRGLATRRRSRSSTSARALRLARARPGALAPRAEALLQRVAGRGRGVRYRDACCGASAPTPPRSPVASSSPGRRRRVRRAVDVARGDAPALADAPAFEARARGSAPARRYVSPRGLRGFRARPGRPWPGRSRRLLDAPELRGVGASAARRPRRRCASTPACCGPPGPRCGRGWSTTSRAAPSALLGRAEPRRRRRGRAARRRRRRAGDGPTRSRRGSSLDLERDLLGRLRRRVHRLARARRRRAGGHARGPHERPAGMREVLARLQDPLAARSPATRARRRPSSR